MDIINLIFKKPQPGSIYYYTTIQDWWDYPTTPFISGVWAAVSIILFVVTSLLLIVRRNFQPLKSRSPLLLWVTMTGELAIVIWACMRMVVGRGNFPCVLYVMFFCLLPPMVFSPIVLRCWRLLFVSKLASTKTLLAAQSTGTEYDSIKRRFAFIKIVISTPFLLLLSIGIVLAHLLILGVALLVQPSKLDFIKGCFGGMVFIGIAACLTLGWGLLALISAIITKILVREPWGIARGIGLTVILIIPTTLFWFGLNAIPVYDYIVERYFPSSFFLFAILITDVILNSLITIALTWTHRAKLNKLQNELEEHKKGLLDILKDEESRKFLKEYSIKSFAPETVAFWEAVDKFKQVVMVKESEEERKSTARRIVADFIDPNGPLALNLTHANEWTTAITFAIDDPAGYYKSIQQKLKLQQETALQEEPSAQQLDTAIELRAPPSLPNGSPDVVLSQSLDTSLSVVMGIRTTQEDNVDFSLGAPNETPFSPPPASSMGGPEGGVEGIEGFKPAGVTPGGGTAGGDGTVYTDMNTDTSSSHHEEDPDEASKRGLMGRSPAKPVKEDISRLRSDIFDELQHWVERDMAQDLYARFKESKYWTDMNTAIKLRRDMLKTGGII